MLVSRFRNMLAGLRYIILGIPYLSSVLWHAFLCDERWLYEGTYDNIARLQTSLHFIH